MPNKSKNLEHMRGKWSQNQLTAALEAIQKGISVRQASIENNIPRKTLERRFKSGNATKDRMGPSCTLGKKNEEKMVQHIKTMQKHGFPFTRDDLKLKNTPRKIVKKTSKETQKKLHTKAVPSSSCFKQKNKLHVSDSNLLNVCVGCEENYDLTLEKVDWIQCIRCKRWLHETCTSFVDVCQTCGKIISKTK